MHERGLSSYHTQTNMLGLTENISIKKNLVVVLIKSPFMQGPVRFTRVPLHMLPDQVKIRYLMFFSFNWGSLQKIMLIFAAGNKCRNYQN